MESEAKTDFIAPAREMKMQEDGNPFEINHLRSKEKMLLKST